MFPLTFQQDGLGLYQEAVELSDAGAPRVRVKLQADLASFANQWMRNIKDQQGDLSLANERAAAEFDAAEGGAS